MFNQEILAGRASMSTPPAFANPWWIVLGSALGLVVGNVAVIGYTFGMFMKPLETEYGWNRELLSGISALSTLAMTVAMPVVGTMMDRWGVRRILIPVMLSSSLTLLLLSFTQNLAMFTALYIVLGVVAAAQGPMAYVKSISGYFDASRGLAVGLALAGTGIGTAIIPVATQYIIDHYGWRYGFAGLAAVLLAIGMPSVLLLVRNAGDPRVRPEAGMASLPEGDAELPGVHPRDALRSRRFWALGVAILLVMLAMQGTIVHVVPMLTDAGYSPQAAASMMIAVGVASMAGRILSGFLVDWIFAPFVGVFFFLLAVVGLLLLDSVTAPVIGVTTLAFALGTEVNLIGFLVSRYFGLRYFGQLYGLIFAMFALGTAIGPYIGGVVYERTHSYHGALIFFAVAVVVACGLLLSLGRYAYPSRKAA